MEKDRRQLTFILSAGQDLLLFGVSHLGDNGRVVHGNRVRFHLAISLPEAGLCAGRVGGLWGGVGFVCLFKIQYVDLYL